MFHSIPVAASFRYVLESRPFLFCFLLQCSLSLSCGQSVCREFDLSYPMQMTDDDPPGVRSNVCGLPAHHFSWPLLPLECLLLRPKRGPKHIRTGGGGLLRLLGISRRWRFLLFFFLQTFALDRNRSLSNASRYSRIGSSLAPP